MKNKGVSLGSSPLFFFLSRVKMTAKLLFSCLLLSVLASTLASQTRQPSLSAGSSVGSLAPSLSSNSPSSSDSDESSGASGQETNSRTVNSFTSPEAGKVTVVSNRNSLLHVGQPPARVTARQLEEQANKGASEEKEKHRVEEDRERQREELNKKDEQEAKQRDRAEKAREEKKKAAEQKEKTDEENNKKQEQERKRQDEAREKQQQAQERQNKEQEVKREQGTKKQQEEQQKRQSEENVKQLGTQLSQGWTNFGAGYQEARLDLWDNLCFVSGRVNGNEGQIALLGTRCRPKDGRLIFALQRGDKPARVDVLPDGRVFLITRGGDGWLTLDGLSFTVDRPRTPELLWNWRRFGDSAYREPTESKNGDLCMISGIIGNGNWGYFAKFRPDCAPQDGRLIFSGNNHETITRIDVIQGNGFLVRAGGSANHGWVALDGIAFTPNGGNNLALRAGWENYGHEYRPAKWTKTGPVCVVSGLIRGNWNEVIAELPAGCRPARTLTFGTNVHDWTATVDVGTDGVIRYKAGRSPHNWIALDGIKFIARQ